MQLVSHDVIWVHSQKFAQEPRHASQILGLAHVQDVVAGEPVQRTAIPVMPEHLRLFGWRQPVTEAGDDEPAVTRNQRLVVERRGVGGRGDETVWGGLS